MTEEYLVRFKKILQSLPDDKKKALHAKLKSLPEADRNAFVKDFVLKFEGHEREKAQAKKPAPSKTDVREKAKAKKNPEAKRPVKKIEVKEDKPAEVKPKNDAPKSEVGQQSTYVLLAVFSILCTLVLVIVAVKNKDDIADLANVIAGESAVSAEVSGVTETDSSAFAEAANAIASSETEQTTPSPTPTPTNVPLPDDHPDLTGLVVVLDPGHQAETDPGMELLDSDTTISKMRCTSGAVGVAANVKEYELTLEIALLTKAYLEECGASVVITRETNDVDISNQERANLAVASSPDVFIRIHCDGAPDSSIEGVRVYVPETGSYTGSSVRMADTLGQLVADARGCDYLGCISTGLYTGLNYADSIRSFQLVTGYISNSADEKALSEEETQYQIASAIAEFCATI